MAAHAKVREGVMVGGLAGGLGLVVRAGGEAVFGCVAVAGDVAVCAGAVWAGAVVVAA